MTLLSTTTLGSANVFDVSAIAATYNDLVLVALVRSATVSGSDSFLMKLNNDAGANYYRQSYLMSQSAATVTESLGAASVSLALIPAASATAGLFAALELTIFGYASTTWKKVMRWQLHSDLAVTTGNVLTYGGGALWNSTAAVSRVTLGGAAFANFDTGSQLRIYGRL